MTNSNLKIFDGEEKNKVADKHHESTGEEGVADVVCVLVVEHQM